MNKFNIIL